MTRQPYRLQAATGIHKGDREYQQDQVQVLSHPLHPGCVMGVIADGMGGRSGGRKASDQVMLTARQLFERFDPVNESAHDLLMTIVQEAHMVIRLTAIASEQEPHSTIAAFVMLPQGPCHVAHSGDSRIYYLRDAQVLWRTMDHSYVQTLVDKGEISELQAQFHPQSNILIGCLGTSDAPPVGYHVIERVDPGEALVACSDGVWHYFSNLELGAIISGLSPHEASKFLIEKARNRAQGMGDNLSVVVIKCAKMTEDVNGPSTVRDSL